MEPFLPPPEPAVTGILARTEQAMARAGERLLIERLHRVLDDEGSAALASLSETLLPLLQALLVVLPGAAIEGASPAVLTAAQTLGEAIQERHVTLSDLATEGLEAHDRLLQAIAADLRASDLALVTAVLQVSRVLLDVERAVLLAYQQRADAALLQAALRDPATGLASRAYFEERLADELRLARRRERSLSLIVMTVDDQRNATDTISDVAGHERLAHLFAALLRTHVRSSDLVTRREDNLFKLLLMETGRDGAMALLQRLRRIAAEQEPSLHLSAGMAISPDQGLTADVLQEQAEQALARTRRSA